MVHCSDLGYPIVLSLIPAQLTAGGKVGILLNIHLVDVAKYTFWKANIAPARGVQYMEQMNENCRENDRFKVYTLKASNCSPWHDEKSCSHRIVQNNLSATVLSAWIPSNSYWGVGLHTSIVEVDWASKTKVVVVMGYYHFVRA